MFNVNTLSSMDNINQTCVQRVLESVIVLDKWSVQEGWNTLIIHLKKYIKVTSALVSSNDILKIISKWPNTI